MKTTIYVVAHKPFKPLNLDGIYKPIKVGSSNEKFCNLVDNTGDNISSRNPSFCELTALYWIWKNDKESDVVGLCHYRRYFTSEVGFWIKQLTGLNSNFLSEKKIQRILSKYDVIVNNSELFKKITIKERFRKSNNIADLEILRDVINEKYPEYIPDFDECMASTVAYFNNMIICDKGIFDQYCEWLFDIIFEVEKRCDISTYDNYQKRLFGFLSERIMRVYFMHNNFKVKECKIVNTEDPCFIKWYVRRRKRIKQNVQR